VLSKMMNMYHSSCEMEWAPAPLPHMGSSLVVGINLYIYLTRTGNIPYTYTLHDVTLMCEMQKVLYSTVIKSLVLYQMLEVI
jgi:hypothetical protein